MRILKDLFALELCRIARVSELHILKELLYSADGDLDPRPYKKEDSRKEKAAEWNAAAREFTQSYNDN